MDYDTLCDLLTISNLIWAACAALVVIRVMAERVGAGDPTMPYGAIGNIVGMLQIMDRRIRMQGESAMPAELIEDMARLRATSFAVFVRTAQLAIAELVRNMGSEVTRTNDDVLDLVR